MARGNTYLAAFLWMVIAFLVIYPLSFLALESFKMAGTDGYGLTNYFGFFKDTYYLKTFANTLLLSALVLATTTVFGIPLAYILARYRQWGKTVFTALILLPIVLPAYAGVFAFVIFFGKWGTVNLLLLGQRDHRQPHQFHLRPARPGFRGVASHASVHRFGSVGGFYQYRSVL